MRVAGLLIITLFFLACSEEAPKNIFQRIELEANLSGNEDYRQSPYVTAGDRIYVVGHQDGSFPDLGWHVTGEMGGVWNHPIKLLDGYILSISNENGLDWCLNNARDFHNYPFGNVFSYSKEQLGLEVQQFQFTPDETEGLMVTYKISNTTNEKKTLKIDFSVMSDLSPVWLWDSLNIVDGVDAVIWDEKNQSMEFKDDSNPWFTSVQASGKWSFNDEAPCEWTRKGLGTSGSISQSITINPDSEQILEFYIGGSFMSATDAQKTASQLKSNSMDMLEKKINLFKKLDNTVQLKVQDKDFARMFRWIKYNTQWLVRDVPDQGRALSAGIPDYPWWFGTDNGYTIQGLLAAGMHEEAISTIDLIFKLSKRVNGNSGKIMHEASTNGIVFNPGNLNTTPNFIYALWKAYEWTGNQRLLEYYDDVKRGISWIESQDKDGNGYPDGPGMMEIPGLHTEMIDVVVYMIKGYQAAANFAVIMEDEEALDEYTAKYKDLMSRLNDEWWSPEFESFADFRSTKKEAMELTEQAIIRADTIDKPWSVEELEQTKATIQNLPDEEIQSFVVHHNWVVNTPMEMGVADPQKAQMALETAKEYRNRFGMFVTGIDRDEAQETSTKWKAFSYVGAVMTLPTGVQAIGSAKYGNPDEALAYLKMLQNSFGYALPGSMYEVSPDFGMIAQAWNIYALAVPIVNHFFGIYPMAHKKEIVIAPGMPGEWSEASLSSVPVGDNNLNISYQIEGNEAIYQIDQSADWVIRFEVENIGKIMVNGRPTLPEDESKKIGIELQGSSNEVKIILP